MKNSPDPARKIGVIDIGSNSVRLTIFDLSSSSPEQILNEKIFCGLAKDIDATGRLHPEGVREALAGLSNYARLAAEHRLEHLDVVGTAALREASDGAEFIASVHRESGLDIRVISGEDEARYAALGVLAYDPMADGLVADFGGGSLEFARVTDGGISRTLSRPYGAYRVLAMGDGASATLTSGLSEIRQIYGDIPALYTIGGAWRSLAQAQAQDRGFTGPIQGYRIAAAEMIAFCQGVMTTEPSQLQERYGFEDKRSQLAPVSALVLAHVLSVLEPRHLIVSSAGIRDGILYDYLRAFTGRAEKV